jgi:pectate lyase
MSFVTKSFWAMCVLSLFFAINTNAQTVLINAHFNTTTALTDLGALVTTGGTVTLSPTKAADGVCSQGMVQVNSAGGFLQVNVSSLSVLTVNMKSTAGARTVKVSYQKQGDAAFTVLTSTLAVSTAAVFDFHTLYPAIISTVPIMVKIEPVSGNIQIHDLYVVSNNAVSNAAEITAFSLPTQSGSATINSTAGTIGVNVPLGTPLTSVIPSILNISANAIINPTAGTARDFSSPVTYTVTAQDGTTSKVWTVTVTAIASSLKEITDFQLAANQIGSSVINSAAGTIAVTMPIGSVLMGIAPTTLTISPSASVSPLASATQDFTAPVVYTVTAQDGSTKTWTVTVTLVDPNATYTDYQGEDAVFTGTVATNHLNYTGTGFLDFATAGPNNVTFTVCQQTAGNQTVKFRYSFAKPPPDIRTAQLLVNNVYIQDILFPVTATFDDWSDAIAIVSLTQGINSIKLYWATTDGPNLDKMSISGAQCASYTLTTATTNGGTITINPSRTTNKYFDVEQVTLTAVNALSATFTNWSGDLTGSTNPAVLTMNSNKSVTANFGTVATYTLTINKTGIGEVTSSPASTGGSYAAGTVVTLTATPLLGNTFTNWTGDASGSSLTTTVTMSANKTVTGNFTSNYTFNFNKVVGYAGMAGDGFTGPTTGGNTTTQPVLCINGPADFNKLCESLYYRLRVWAGRTPTGGMLKQPLIILIKAGTYDASQALTATGANTYGNSMLDIADQADLTFIGEGNVTFNFGINVKRSSNIIIRNISFHSYGDDGVNVGYPETHHIWIDHCTFGHPTTYPASADVPDGTTEVKDGASYVTISWCKYQNHHKTCLLGHSDNNGATDMGRLKVTYFANYFNATNSRHPRTRFGTVHVLNNMYENVGRGRASTGGLFGYGIGASNNSQVWAEGNFFLDTRWPMSADRSTTDFATVYGPLMSQNSNIACYGLKSVNNDYDDSGLTLPITGQVKPEMINPSGMSIKFDELTSPNFTYVPSSDYNYTADLLPAAAVKILIPLNAGADKMNWGVSCATIPLGLVDFSVKKVNNEAVLTWKTVNEQEVSHFDVERSNDGKAFYSVGKVKPNNTLAQSIYNLTDKGPLSIIQYYRLKMVDLDGKVTFSKILSLSNSDKGVNKLSVYPSIVSDNLTVETTLNEAATLKIVDVLGKVVLSKTIAASNSISTDVLPISVLPIGFYTVVIENKEIRLTEKFIKQ